MVVGRENRHGPSPATFLRSDLRAFPSTHDLADSSTEHLVLPAGADVVLIFTITAGHLTTIPPTTRPEWTAATYSFTL